MLSERVRILLETQASLAASQKQAEAVKEFPKCRCGHPKENHLWGEGHCTCRVGGSHYCQCGGYNKPAEPVFWPCCTADDTRDTRDPNSEMMTKFTKQQLAHLRVERTQQRIDAKQNGQ